MNDKKLKIMELLTSVYDPLLKFFDLDSEEMLDEKIEVLTALKNGKSINDIPNFYKVLELYPNDNEIWD